MYERPPVAGPLPPSSAPSDERSSDVRARHVAHVFDEVMAGLIKDGDEPATVAKVIVAAATDPKPKLR